MSDKHEEEMRRIQEEAERRAKEEIELLKAQIAAAKAEQERREK